MTGAWTSHNEIIPASAAQCDSIVALASRVADSLSMGFANHPNAWVTIVDHLEKRGFDRTGQSTDTPDARPATLRTGGTTVGVCTSRYKGRTSLVMVLETKP